MRQQSEYEGLGPATNFSGASLVHHLLNGKSRDACPGCSFIQHLCIKHSPRAGLRGSIDEASSLEKHTDLGICPWWGGVRVYVNSPGGGGEAPGDNEAEIQGER